MNTVVAEAVEGMLSEMAVAKLPEGVKKVRSKTHSSSHHIFVDGEHAGMIQKLGSSYNPRAGRSESEYGVYKDEKDSDNYVFKDGSSHGHPAHQEEKEFHNSGYHHETGEHVSYSGKYKDTRRYGSYDDAVSAVVHTHRNNKEFGEGHDPRERWKKAADSVGEATKHDDAKWELKKAESTLRKHGLHEQADHVKAHSDSLKSHIDKAKIHQWTHDAHRYMGSKYDYETWENKPSHPEHHEAANQAKEAAQKAGVSFGHHNYRA